MWLAHLHLAFLMAWEIGGAERGVVREELGAQGNQGEPVEDGLRPVCLLV